MSIIMLEGNLEELCSAISDNSSVDSTSKNKVAISKRCLYRWIHCSS